MFLRDFLALNTQQTGKDEEGMMRGRVGEAEKGDRTGDRKGRKKEGMRESQSLMHRIRKHAGNGRLPRCGGHITHQGRERKGS